MVIAHHPITLIDLPAPPTGKTGWPWTEETKPLPDRMSEDSEWPKISIVTPSYNQGQFLEETIRSVLLQGYPNLEYLIIDGGSTDNSVEIIQKYERYLSYWVSEPDRGQANAINKGLRQATGELIGWQNSDDCYCPNAFFYAAQVAKADQTADIIYGSVDYVNSDGVFSRKGYASEFSFLEMLPWTNMFNQSMFFRRKVFTEGNFIDESFQHCMDYEFFWRLALADYKFQFEPRMKANFRFHENAKGVTQYDIFAREIVLLYKQIYGHPKIPVQVREKALDCIRNQCIDCFGKSKFSLFQETLSDLLSINKVEIFKPALFIRYLICLFGQENALFLKEIYRKTSNSLSLHSNIHKVFL